MNAVHDPSVSAFHQLFYAAAGQGGTWRAAAWFGVPVLKCPLDLWAYQEILWEIRPQLIIECGTYRGGTALFLAHLCDLLGAGEVVTIDVEPWPLRAHPRVKRLLGGSTSPGVYKAVRRLAAGKAPVLVILDSDHRAAHVAGELDLYGALVTQGSYLIVEDTNVNGRPVLPDFGPGPHEAVSAFLAERPDFEVDATREKFLMTFNPGGYVRRRR